MKTRKGITLIELLVVIAVMAVILSIAAFSGRRTLLSQEQAAFLRSLQGLFWQGATEAASRGETLVLSRQGNRLEIRRGSQVVRTVDIPQGVGLSLGYGDVARFTPP
ncbi:prepilin-type N-terminal cleavage/methylation domain-containing protein, partial [Acinetobacter baumannii]